MTPNPVAPQRIRADFTGFLMDCALQKNFLGDVHLRTFRAGTNLYLPLLSSNTLAYKRTLMPTQQGHIVVDSHPQPKPVRYQKQFDSVP